MGTDVKKMKGADREVTESPLLLWSKGCPLLGAREAWETTAVLYVTIRDEVIRSATCV